MKRYLFIFAFLQIVISSGAQVKQEVIASAGDYNLNGNLSISWTLGETIIPTFTSADNSVVLTHGFQQQMIITSIEENLDIRVNVKVFPNPASDFVNIQFEAPVDEEIELSVFDSQGKIFKIEKIKPATSERQINLQDVPSGVCFLRLAKGKFFNIYKVVKL